jgi:amidohydrolase
VAVRNKMGSIREKLIELSHRIHGTPELGFEEEHACNWLSEFLIDAGFSVQAGICDVPTAFHAQAGSGPLHIAICAEYDALPGIGHACGHNIIAASAVGAAIAAAAVADDIGLTVEVLGTPGEEVGNASGKILLLERGAFSKAHLAMMVHPGPVDVAAPKIISASMFDVRYTGKEAHASAFPELGINAGDALTIAQTSIGLLRQHIRASDRMHGVITKGGDAPNIIPGHTAARYMIRSETMEELEELRPRVYHCFEAGAIATGAKLAILGGEKPYAHMIHDHEIAAIYQSNAECLGRKFGDGKYERAAISTDMGNLSLAVAAIHPMIGIDCLPAVNHQPEFGDHCVRHAADQAIADGALAMALTSLDVARNSHLRERLMNKILPQVTMMPS